VTASLNSINQPISKMEKQFVYSDVGTEFVSNIEMSLFSRVKIGKGLCSCDIVWSKCIKLVPSGRSCPSVLVYLLLSKLLATFS
jgi:hypothetical protein